MLEIWIKCNFRQKVEDFNQISREFWSKSQYFGEICKDFGERSQRSYFSNILVIISNILIEIWSNFRKDFGQNLEDLVRNQYTKILKI